MVMARWFPISAGLWFLVVAEVGCQSTETVQTACTYSFVVPQSDLVSNCKSYSQQQMVNLQAKVDQLQKKISELSEDTMITPKDVLNPKFTCTCQNNTLFEFSFRDCQDVKSLTGSTSGIYEVNPIKSTGQLISIKDDDRVAKNQKYWVATTWDSVKVFCDLEDEDVGWTVIMRRTKMDVSFDRDWYDYKSGFGQMAKGGDFWFGLENLFQLTTQSFTKFVLWIVIKDSRRVPHIIPYGEFRIDDEDGEYKITLDDYHGTGTQGMTSARPFVARDRTVVMPTSGYYYETPRNCAALPGSSRIGGGGWWFTGSGSSCCSPDYQCGQSNLNAWKPYWYGITNITSVVMKIRPAEI